MSKKSLTDLHTLGATELVSVFDCLVPAKIDTGAFSSAIWASDIKVKNQALEFKLFGPTSRFYTGKTIRHKDFRTVRVKSSNGQSEIRYSTHLSIKIAGRRIRATFTLADRSRNRYPILIGRRAIKNKFLVDVNKNNANITS